jgi:hypothetical protein
VKNIIYEAPHCAIFKRVRNEVANMRQLAVSVCPHITTRGPLIGYSWNMIFDIGECYSNFSTHPIFSQNRISVTDTLHEDSLHLATYLSERWIFRTDLVEKILWVQHLYPLSYGFRDNWTNGMFISCSLITLDPLDRGPCSSPPPPPSSLLLFIVSIHELRSGS